MKSVKNFLMLTGIVFLLGLVFQPFLPWWTIALAGGLPALFFKNKSVLNFFAGFTGIALLWGIYAGWIDAQNEGILSGQIGQIFNGLSSSGLILTTAGLGGIIGGLAAMTGGLGRALFSSGAS